MKEQIVRQMLRNCCDFCRKLAGVYEYGTEPQEVYMRHDNCRCLVTHRTAAGHYVNVHSKVETDTYKQQRMMRLKELDENGETEKLFQQRRRIARAKNRPYDATEEWYYHAKPNSHKVEVATAKEMREITERKYGEQNRIVFDYASISQREKEVAEFLERTFGGEIKLLARIDNPDGMKMADYLFHGELLDLKEIMGNGKNSVYNRIKDSLAQSRSFVVDISSTKMTRKEALRQIESIWLEPQKRRVKQNIDTVILIDGDELIGVFMK